APKVLYWWTTANLHPALYRFVLSQMGMDWPENNEPRAPVQHRITSLVGLQCTGSDWRPAAALRPHGRGSCSRIICPRPACLSIHELEDWRRRESRWQLSCQDTCRRYSCREGSDLWAEL